MPTDPTQPASPDQPAERPLLVVRGSATDEELHALHHVLATRSRADRLRAWRRGRREALRQRPEVTGDR